MIYVLLIAGVLIGWFYWFQWRPVNIRQQCYQNTFGAAYGMKALENYDKKWVEGKVWTYDRRYGASAENWGWFYPIPVNKLFAQQSYAECLVRNGMKIEKVLVQ